MLDSHPDIFCVHAGNWAWHNFGGAQLLDGVPYLQLLGAQGHAHAAAGDVHGVSGASVPALRAEFGERFNAVVIVREPLARFRSQMHLFHRWKQYQPWDISHVDAIIEQRGVRLPNPSAYTDRFVVHAARMLDTIVDDSAVGRIYRAEDITSSSSELGELVAELTRERVAPDQHWLQAAVSRKPEATHAHSSWGDASAGELLDWQVDVIRRVVSPKAWEAYAELGYQKPAFL